jgi:ferrous iron transport protein B
LGIVAWQLAAAVVTGMIAKENVVGTIAVCYGITSFAGIDGMDVMGLTKVAALAYLMLNLFTPPCFAAIGAMNAEIKSRKWLWAGIGLQLSVGFVTSFLVFFFGTLLAGASFGAAWMPIVGWAITLVIVAIFTALVIKNNKTQKVKGAK